MHILGVVQNSSRGRFECFSFSKSRHAGSVCVREKKKVYTDACFCACSTVRN